MHELWFCRQILEIIKNKAESYSMTEITKIYLVIGELLAIDELSLSLNFEVLSQGTCAEKADLVVIKELGEAECLNCQRPFVLHQYYEPCPLCLGHQFKLFKGESFNVQGMEGK